MLHPLVHTWARERLSTTDKLAESASALGLILNTTKVLASYDSVRTMEDWALERRLLPHLDTTLSWIPPDADLKMVDYDL